MELLRFTEGPVLVQRLAGWRERSGFCPLWGKNGCMCDTERERERIVLVNFVHDSFVLEEIRASFI